VVIFNNAPNVFPGIFASFLVPTPDEPEKIATKNTKFTIKKQTA
jgi:hypothetical protein